jgi:hypothetical protein
MLNRQTAALAALALTALMSFCRDAGEVAVPLASSYVVAVRTEGNTNNTTDYLVQTGSLTSGTLSTTSTATNPVIEQAGRRSYGQVGKFVFSIGTGITYREALTAIGYALDPSNQLKQVGSIKLDKNFDVLTNVDDKTLGGIQIPRNASENKTAVFYTANTLNLDQLNRVQQSLAPLFKQDMVWPSGMRIRDNKAYVPYYLQDRIDYSTPYTDTAYVAVYSYPDFTLEKILKDIRTGPAGSFNSNNAIFKAENGDLFTLSTLGYTFSKRTKPAGFLRIKNGESSFDQSYFFNTDQVASGQKIYFAQYVGSGKVLAEIGQLPTANAQWAYDDVTLKTVIFDLATQTMKTVTGGIPAHAGQSGNTLSFPVEDGKAYLPITSYTEGTYIWQIDLSTATATRGAKVDGKYVAGIFKVQ